MTNENIQELGLADDGNVKFSMGLALMGLWLMAAPFLLRYSSHTTATINDILVGFLTVFLSIATTVTPVRLRSLVWVNSYLGLWLCAAPFVLGYLSDRFPDSGAVPMWNDLVCGFVVWFLSYMKALSRGKTENDLQRVQIGAT
jgi:hypothetical protein